MERSPSLSLSLFYFFVFFKRGRGSCLNNQVYVRQVIFRRRVGPENWKKRIEEKDLDGGVQQGRPWSHARQTLRSNKGIASTVTIMPRLCHDNRKKMEKKQPPCFHFAGAYRISECLNGLIFVDYYFFFKYHSLLMFVNLVRGQSVHVSLLVIFNQPLDTLLFIAFQESLPKSIKF